jgi:hypothetical protein
MKLAAALEKVNPGAAADRYRAVMEQHPGTDLADRAEERIKRLEESSR